MEEQKASLSQQQAKEALSKGCKLTHRLFNNGESVRQIPKQYGRDMYEFEDGVQCTANMFWHIRKGKHWQSGWEIVNEHHADIYADEIHQIN